MTDALTKANATESTPYASVRTAAGRRRNDPRCHMQNAAQIATAIRR
jgi:hypothetical protein